MVDNSDNIDNALKEKINHFKKVEYIQNKANIGIAAALNIGAKKAIEDGFEYLLTMDQDSEAPDSMVSTLLECFSHDSNVALVSPVLQHPNGKKHYS